MDRYGECEGCEGCEGFFYCIAIFNANLFYPSYVTQKRSITVLKPFTPFTPFTPTIDTTSFRTRGVCIAVDKTGLEG